MTTPPGERRRPRLVRVIATTLVAILTCLVAVWIAPRASGAAATWIRTPSVRLHTLTLPGDGRLPVAGASSRAAAPVTLDAGMRFTMAGVVCAVPRDAVTVRLRTSLDGASWGPWMETPLEVAGEDDTPRAFTDPLWTGDARYAQVAAAGSGTAPAALTNVRLVAIDPAEDADLATRAVGAVRRTAAAVAGVSLAPPASAATAAPAIVTRSQWGADEKLRSGSPSYASVKMAFVHHTASGNAYARTDAAALVRGVYAYHTKSLGWSDIGYNFLVDRFGTVYEGRYGGMDRGVVGAHVYGFNTGSTGISVMGTYTSEAPAAAAMTALERLLAWKLSVHGLDPARTAKLTCGAGEKYAKGASVTFPVIAGHRDANYTECPGSALYPLLPGVRTRVARRVQAALVARLSAGAPLISPNGDGVLDETTLNVTISTAADWQLTIRDARGDTVASWSGQGTSATITWRGTSGGDTVPDGVYSADLTASAGGDEAAPAMQAITVDTEAPRLASASAAPTSFSPNGDARAETTTATFSPAEACAVRVGILDADGKVVRWLHGWRARGTRPYSVVWDGAVRAAGKLVPAGDGQYRFDVERRDAAGNIARRGIRVTLDRTLGFPKAIPMTLSPNGDGRRDTTELAFKLARRATVTLSVWQGSTLARTLDLGTLDAGTRTTTWDGTNDAGEYLPSGRPVFTVTAVSTLGESSVSKTLVIDLYRPRLYATKGKTVRLGKTARLAVKAHDPFSAKVDVRFVVTNAKGRRVASGHPGWVPAEKAHTVVWRPRSRGVFTITWRATDRGGNREAKTARTRVNVR